MWISFRILGIFKKAEVRKYTQGRLLFFSAFDIAACVNNFKSQFFDDTI